MINFNKRNVNILSFLVSSIIFILIVLILNYPRQYNQSYQKYNNETKGLNNNTHLNHETRSNTQANSEIELSDIVNWNLEIKSLNIKGPIKEMETDTPSAEYIGHFKETSILGNNIALIAYNFGEHTNYFANLKELKVGDEIIYRVNDTIKTYKVFSNQIIEKASLNSVLLEYNQNEAVLKLFTYVKDLDNKLRYICAK